jgi:hypothetical protein
VATATGYDSDRAWRLATVSALRPLRVELRRGTAPAAAVAALVSGGLALHSVADQLVPSRLAAPVAAVVVYALMVGAMRLGGVVLLAPVLPAQDGGGFTLTAETGVRQAIWFLGLTATLLVAVGARRWWLAAIPGAIAIIAFSLLRPYIPELAPTRRSS